MNDASFAMMVCAHGAEAAIKTQLRDGGWRLAFSRPGLVTAKHDRPNQAPPSGTFIRTAMTSLGQCRLPKPADGELNRPDGNELLDQLVKIVDQHPMIRQREGKPLEALHVFPRDRHPIGKFDFEPGVDELSKMIADAVQLRLADRIVHESPNRIVEPWRDVLDVVLVAPDHWMVGMHRALDVHGRWPGGVQPIAPKYKPISRAYFKAAEAIAFAEFDLQAGDTAVEIGSAPGGACGFLLEQGLHVIGIDPAEMDPRITRHKRFRHLRARGGDLKRSIYAGADWLLVDSNVRPDQTLTTVENVVTHPTRTLRGAIITLKLGGYHQVAQIERWIQRIETWEPEEIRVKQLARNKVEVCVAVRLRRPG
ncbi:MAG: SAM-dependent methyltransferase [Planctomycetota bacterium]